MNEEIDQYEETTLLEEFEMEIENPWR